MSDEKKEETPQLEWEYKTEFGINTKMREVIQATLKVAEASIESYRKKIEKLTYGS